MLPENDGQKKLGFFTHLNLLSVDWIPDMIWVGFSKLEKLDGSPKSTSFTTFLTTRFKVIPLPEYLTSTMQVGNLALMLCLLILCTQVGVMHNFCQESSMSQFVGMVWGWWINLPRCQVKIWEESFEVKFAIMHLKSRFDYIWNISCSIACGIQTHFDIKIWDLSSPRPQISIFAIYHHATRELFRIRYFIASTARPEKWDC